MLSAVVMAAIGATAGLTIWHNRGSVLKEHERDLSRMGVVLAEQTSRYAQLIDLTVRDVRSKIAALNVTNSADFRQRWDNREFHNYLAERLKIVPQADETVQNMGVVRLLSEMGGGPNAPRRHDRGWVPSDLAPVSIT
jgi:hypothetical protein